MAKERTQGCVPGRGTDLYNATAARASTKRARRSAIGAPALLIAGALLVAVCPLSAQQPQPQPQASVAGAPPVDATPLPEAGRTSGAAAGGVVSTGDFVRMVVVLAAVLGAIYLLFRLFRRGAAGRLGNSELIAVLGSRSLGGNRSLHLVRAAGGYYLVGAGDQAVNLVAEITDPERLDRLAAHPAGQGASARSRFADLLAEAGIGTPSDARSADSGHTAFLRRQRERARRLGDRAPLQRDRAPLQRDRAPLQRDRAPLQRDRAPLQRDRAPLQRDRAPLQRDRARRLGDRAPRQRDRARRLGRTPAVEEEVRAAT